MAITPVNANLVRQKAYNAVYGAGTTVHPISPFHFYAIKALFLHLAANKGNPDLQFVPYAAEDIVANNGYQPTGAGAGKLYAWFMTARRTSATTAAFQAIHDAADNSATTTTVATQLINLTGQTALFTWPDGFPLATQLTISSATAVGGATESTAALATDGFVIVGAA